MLYGHLLERGSTEHVTVMSWAAVLLAALFVKAVITRIRGPLPAPPRGRGLELYAAAMLALFLFGPMSLEWPSSFWMVYPRFGTIALVFPFLLPRCDLRGVAGAAATAACVTLVAWNASINAGHVERFNGWARQYDQVRETIPPRSRVLALTLPDSGDMTNLHPALGSLYFYHMVDGASYVAFLFDAAALPVRQRQDVKPRAPFWRNVRGFNPKIHGVDFDYLVLRGTTLTTRTSQAGMHKRVASINGWDVFQTLQPSPRPQSQ